MMFDGLTCASTVRHGALDRALQPGRISRERQDEFSARSHQLAAAAIALASSPRRSSVACPAQG